MNSLLKILLFLSFHISQDINWIKDNVPFFLSALALLWQVVSHCWIASSPFQVTGSNAGMLARRAIFSQAYRDHGHSINRWDGVSRFLSQRAQKWLFSQPRRSRASVVKILPTKVVHK